MNDEEFHAHATATFHRLFAAWNFRMKDGLIPDEEAAQFERDVIAAAAVDGRHVKLKISRKPVSLGGGKWQVGTTLTTGELPPIVGFAPRTDGR